MIVAWINFRLLSYTSCDLSSVKALSLSKEKQQSPREPAESDSRRSKLPIGQKPPADGDSGWWPSASAAWRENEPALRQRQMETVAGKLYKPVGFGKKIKSIFFPIFLKLFFKKNSNQISWLVI